MSSTVSRPRETSLDAPKSSSIEVAIHENKQIPSGKGRPNLAGDNASSEGKVKQSIHVTCTRKPPCPRKRSGKKAEKATNVASPKKLSGKKAKKETNVASWPFSLPPKPLRSSRNDRKNKAKAINEVVSVHSLTTKRPLAPKQSKEKLSDEKWYCDCKSKNFNIQEGLVMYNLLHYEKYPSNRPMPEAAWNGNFEIHDMMFPGKFCGGFWAHPPQRPCITDSRVHLFSKQMPKVLQFELLPCGHIWTKIFKSDSAFGEDISLYFFPGQFERSIEQYVNLWWLMEKEDLVLRSCMYGVELLVFTSQRLHYAEELNWISFLWGVFHIAKNDGVSAGLSTTNKISQTHALGGETTVKQHLSLEEIKKINDLEVPPGFSRKDATIKQNLSVEEIKRLNDFEVPSGLSRKDAGEAANDAILDKLYDLVEVPVQSHPALVRGSDYWSNFAQTAIPRPMSSKRRAGGRCKRP